MAYIIRVWKNHPLSLPRHVYDRTDDLAQHSERNGGFEMYFLMLCLIVPNNLKMFFMPIFPNVKNI